MYIILANIVDFIHILVLIFILGGLFISYNGKLRRVRIFHDYFVILVLILQSICGLKCPLVILSDNLRHLGDPSYEILYEPFTEKLFMKLFGISISSNLVLIVILLLAVLAIAHILTVRKIKSK